MRPLFRIIPFFILGLGLLVSTGARAEFQGCHNWCGKQANNAWWAVMHSHGVTSGSQIALIDRHRSEANAAKEETFRTCMQQTLAEGKTSDADCDGASSAPENPQGGNQLDCKAEALQVIAACESNYGSASGSCASSRVDTIVQQAQAANEQQLNQSGGSYAQTCSATAQAYQNAVSQIGSVQSSCQSAVSQCSSECGRAQSAIQQCQDPEVLAKRIVVSAALQSCSSGTLSRRPVEIARATDSLRQSAGEASQCAQNTGGSGDQGAKVAASPGGGFGKGKVDASGGSLNSKPGSLSDQSDLSGNFSGPDRSYSGGVGLPKDNSSSGPGGSAIDETYDVTGKNAATASSEGDMMASNAALAALPGTPSQMNNGEKTDARSGESAAGTAAADGSGGVGGGGGGGGRYMLMPLQGGGLGKLRQGNGGLNAAGASGTGNESPDLSAFLPGQRGVAGGVIAGLAGCRIPDPRNPKQCAIPHGPSANIWTEVKQRFELLRNAPPPADYFFNED